MPQEVTAIAWSWIGSDEVHHETLLDGPEAMFGAFLADYERADMVTGHNLIRFDLPVLNADLLRHGFPSLGAKLVQDTIRIVKTKGFKKGQDNLSTLIENPIGKMPLNWQEWHNAYKEPGWPTVIERVTSDVRGHKLLRERMLERGWVRRPVMWSP